MTGFFAALAEMATPTTFFFMFGGTALGIIVGAIPGVTGGMGIALLLPLTVYMTINNALTMMVSMYVGGIAGGLVTAILLRIPGEPASIVTTFDGYPMAQKGQPGRALALGIGASLVGGLFSWVALVTLTYPLSEIAVKLRPFDLLGLILMALVLIAALGQGTIVKGLISGFLGIMIAMPGTDPATGGVRLTFGFHQLEAGFSTLSVLIGSYALSQIFFDTLHKERKNDLVDSRGQQLRVPFAEWRAQLVNLLRSSFLGTWVGILPGIGATVGSLICYSVARSASKTPEKFGTGVPDGIVASEAGNSATVGGALIPLISLGIPASVTDVFLLAALIMQGLQPGPLLFTSNPEIAYIVFASCLTANLAMFVILTGGMRWVIKLMMVPIKYLFPIILVFCVIGAFGENNRLFDVWVMLGFGVFGFMMERTGFPLGPFVIGFVLGPIAEKSLRAGLTLSDGSYLDIFQHPVSAVAVSLSVVIFFWSLLSQHRLSQRMAAVGAQSESK